MLFLLFSSIVDVCIYPARPSFDLIFWHHSKQHPHHSPIKHIMLEPDELNLKSHISNVLYMTGLLCKGRTDEEIRLFLSISDIPFLEIARGNPSSPSDRGKLWVRYETMSLAQKAQASLHQQSFQGCTVMVRFELGFDRVSGKRWISRKSVHTTCIRRIQQRRGGESRSKSPASDLPPASYSYKSLSLGETEYPFPSGLYLARLISLIQKTTLPQNDPIHQLLSNNYLPAPSNPKKARPTSTFGNKYAKEITESMAMVDAVERAMKLCLGQSPPPKESWHNNNNNNNSSSSSACHDNNSQRHDHYLVRVYCVGDGKYPLTAAAMAFHYPEWECISIDPILEPLPCAATSTDNEQPNRPRLVQFSGLSQDYRIPPIPEMNDRDGGECDDDDFLYLDIVVACHSHAPLQEFWDRIVERHIRRRGPPDSSSSTGGDKKHHRHSALAITMACCANYSDLQQEPALVFEDFEVYSPKREIRIFHAEDVIAQSYCRRVANPSDMAIPYHGNTICVLSNPPDAPPTPLAQTETCIHKARKALT